MRNADVDHFALCKHLRVFTEGETVFPVQLSKKGSSKGKNSATDQKPTLGSTGNVLLFLSTASVSNSLRGTQALGTNTRCVAPAPTPLSTLILFLFQERAYRTKIINLILQMGKQQTRKLKGNLLP